MGSEPWNNIKKMTEIPFYIEKENINEVMDRIKKEANKMGIIIDGDNKKGKFYSLNAKGTYEIAGRILKLNIDEKPPFISDSDIRKGIEFYLK